MIKGLYSAVSAMLVNANRQQILSHNISNLDTPGFKQVLSDVEDFMSTQVSYPAGGLLGDTSIENIGTLGLGAKSGPETINFTQGGLQITGNTLDVAIQGDGFFHVRTPEGDRYTRDGRFLRDTSGTLTTTEGFAVLGSNNQPIKLPDGLVGINTNGDITVNGEQVATFGLVIFDNPNQSLQHTDGNMYTATTAPKSGTAVMVNQGALEMSNVDATQAMAQLVEISRAYEAAQQMVQNQDELLGKTISTLGRIG